MPWRVLEQTEHGLQGRQERLLRVLRVVPLALVAANLFLVSSLVVIRLLHQHQALYGDEHLQHVGVLGGPNLGAFPLPRVQQAQAHLPGLVQVGVDTLAERVVVRLGGLGWVRRGEVEVEHEEVIVVRCAARTHEHGSAQIHAILVHSAPHGVRDGCLQHGPFL